MFNESKRTAILELHKLGHSIRGIARALRAARITVRRIVRIGTAQVPTILRRNKVEPYRAQIIDLCSRCRGNVQWVHRELIAQGAQFFYPALNSFVRRNRIEDPKSTVTRSSSAAQQWVTELLHGSRSLEIPSSEADDSSDLPLYSTASRTDDE
jgi:hypothetical protein